MINLAFSSKIEIVWMCAVFKIKKKCQSQITQLPHAQQSSTFFGKPQICLTAFGLLAFVSSHLDSVRNLCQGVYRKICRL